jgi:hypothetical protein
VRNAGAWASASKNGVPIWMPTNAAIGEIEENEKLLIRAEDKNRWERRAPLVPEDLADILEDTGARAFVEKSDKRFFGMDQYAAAGAAVL